MTLPVRLGPGFHWETTQLLNRVVAQWGEVPAAFLLGCNPRRHTYAYVGLEDRTMFPLVQPGSLLYPLQTQYLHWESKLADSLPLTSQRGMLVYPLLEINVADSLLPISLYIPPLRGGDAR